MHSLLAQFCFQDLLKYTSTDHPDHPLIVEVSGALFDLFEQVNVDNSRKVCVYN